MATLPVLEYLKKAMDGSLEPGTDTHMRYPTAISRLLGLRITEVGEATATVELVADAEVHGNQQGTVHGGMLCELADAAIGTAHSTIVGEGESFASIDLKINFFRPVWRSRLRARARSLQRGNTVSHYVCEVTRDDGKIAAVVLSSVMTLRGDKARGR